MLKLYYAPGTISIAVALTLEEAGLPYTPVAVDFSEAEQTKPGYLAVNPKGRVPALVAETGAILTETGALLEYIAARAPQAGLIPQGLETAAHMRSVMYYLASTMHVAHAHKMRGHRWAQQQSSFDDMKAMIPQTMAACAEHIEAHCLRGDFVTGDRLSLADPYLYVVTGWLEGDGVPLDRFPAIRDFRARMEQRDSVAALRNKGLV